MFSNFFFIDLDLNWLITEENAVEVYLNCHSPLEVWMFYLFLFSYFIVVSIDNWFSFYKSIDLLENMFAKNGAKWAKLYRCQSEMKQISFNEKKYKHDERKRTKIP